MHGFVDQFYQQKERSRGDFGRNFYSETIDLVRNNQDKKFIDIELTNLKSISLIRNSTTDKEVSTKNNVDDELHKNSFYDLIKH